MKIGGRQVAMFRCHIDPMIGPKPRNAFVPSDLNMKAFISQNETGVVVQMADGTEHFIFSANIQSVRLSPDIEPISINDAKRGRSKISGAV